MVSDRQNVWRRTPSLVRFGAIGIVNTLFGFTAYAFLVWTGLHYALAALLATIAGVLFNFVTTGGLVFDARPSAGRLVRFVMVYGALYLLNVAGLHLLIGTGLGPYAAALVLVVPMAFLSFLMMRTFVFGSRTWR